MLKMAVQQDRSRWKHRRRSLLTRPPRTTSAVLSRWATLKMLSMRERYWRVFSASCQKNYRRILRSVANLGTTATLCRYEVCCGRAIQL